MKTTGKRGATRLEVVEKQGSGKRESGDLLRVERKGDEGKREVKWLRVVEDVMWGCYQYCFPSPGPDPGSNISRPAANQPAIAHTF